MTGLLRGRLLVATPVLSDPNFDQSVVLVLEHGDDGAVGVVLNRPSATDVVEPLPGWRPLAAEPPVVFVGGPVAQGAAVGLARAGVDLAGEAWSPVVGRIGTVDLSLDPHHLGPGVEVVRVFSGYAGWAPGQLEAEIAAAAWLVVDAEPDEILGPDPETLWPRVLRRQPPPVALLATFTRQPELN